MPKLVVHGATLQCSQGLAPGSLNVVAAPTSDNESGVATIFDTVPNTNIVPFGMCRSLANPQVASATTAAQGVLTPQPCLPVIPGPWTPGATVVTVDGKPALTDGSTCTCAWTGTISIVGPGSSVDLD